MKLKLKSQPAIEPISLTEACRQLRLDITSLELSSGTLTVGSYYLITACQADAFYAGCKVGDTFKAASATALSSNNKVREIYEGAYLSSLILAAREYVEKLCGPLITQSWYQYHDGFPAIDVIDLGKPRVLAITAIKYTADGEEATTFASTNYTLDNKDDSGCRVVLHDDADWPSDELEEVNPVEIEFTCGYGPAASDVPEPIRLAMLLLVSDWYRNRSPVVNITGSMVETPFAVNALLTNYRCWGF